MDPTNRNDGPQSHNPQDGGTVFASHEFRLSVRQWVAVCVIVAAALGSAPVLWERAEPLAPGQDHRTPYELSEDYWLYGRLGAQAASQSKTLVIGDSVIWGQYVRPDQTLTHYLNAYAGDDRFTNLGVNGTHPVALAGLIEHYCADVTDQRVLLHCNPLWMASAARDLQTAKQVSFNHPGLVPQFVPRIPCYKATTDERLSVVAGRLLPHNRWAKHLRVAYFDNTDIPTWTIEHPRANPLDAITFETRSPQSKPRRRPVSWQTSGVGQADFPWVDLDMSLQWRSFRRLVNVLTRRGNEVFVCVGPLNEHMLTEPSRLAYSALKSEIEAWLSQNAIPHFLPPVLPSGLYADASHPLSQGYALLARQLYGSDAFVSFAGRSEARVPRRLK